MRTILLASTALMIMSCGDKDPEESAEPCGVEIRETYPAINSTSAYYRGDVEFVLSAPDETAELSIDGVTGDSVRSADNLRVVFTPSAPLAAGTSYTATLSYCSGEAPVTFTTSTLGTPLTDPSVLEGSVYSLNLQDGRIVIPAGVGSVLEQYLEVTLFIKVDSASGGTLNMYGALADDAGTAQDYCSPTLDFPEADFSAAPYFAIGPQDTTIAVAGFEVTIDDLFISGDFAADGSFWGGGVLEGKVDTRPLVDLIEEGGEEDAVCGIVEGFGVFCEPCPADGEPFCLSIKAVDLGGEQVSTSVEPISMSDCHELCPDSVDNPECEL